MPFALSGSTITQSGTDADLSGLAGIAGVTTIQQGTHTVYNMGNFRLLVTGTLSQDPEFEELVFGTGVPVRTLEIASGGTYNVGLEVDIGAPTNRFTGGTWVRFTDANTNSFRESEASLRIEGGGTLNWFGGALYTSNVVAFMENSNVNIFSQQCQIIFQTGSAQLRQRSTGLNVAGLVTRGTFMTMIAAPARLDGWSPFDSGNQALSVSGSTPDNVFIPVGNFDVGGLSGQQVAYFSGAWIRLINPSAGSSIDAQGNSSTSNLNTGLYEVRQTARLSASSFSGQSVAGLRVYTADTDNGNRLAASSINNNPDYLATREYPRTFTDSGQITIDEDGGILTALLYRTTGGVRADNNMVDRRSLNNDGTDVFRFVAYRYGFNIAIVDTGLVGLGGTDVPFVMFDDTSITEPDVAVTRALTEISSTNELYDRYCVLFEDLFSGQTDLIVSRSGDTFNAGGFDVVVDPAAPDVLALSGNTLTLRGTEVSGSIQTTGVVTLAGDARFTGIITDAAGSTGLLELF